MAELVNIGNAVFATRFRHVNTYQMTRPRFDDRAAQSASTAGTGRRRTMQLARGPNAKRPRLRRRRACLREALHEGG